MAVDLELLRQQESECDHEPARHLADVDRGVKLGPEIHENVDAVYEDFTREDIDRHLGDGSTVGRIVVRVYLRCVYCVE